MITTDQIRYLLTSDATVIGNDHARIGKIGQVFLDDQTGEPEWVTVKMGLFGTAESFIPLARATLSGDEVQVPYDKDEVKDAPRIDDTEGHLRPDEEAELYRYYGLDYSHAESDTGLPGGDRRGQPTSRPSTDDAMTRSEERLHVGTEKQEAGRARLRKYVVTENVTQTVPVSHEEARIVREPVTDADRERATTDEALGEEEHEVTLNAERPVVEKETVPVERVRLDKETVTENEQVNEDVREERIETDPGARRKK